MDPPHPGGLSEPMCEWCGEVAMMMFVCLFDDVCGSCIRFTYLFRDTTVGPHPKIDTLTLKKKIDPPHPRGV